MGIAYKRLRNRPLRKQLSQRVLGTCYWNYTKRHHFISDIMRNFPNDKALGPDNISDRWLRKQQNAIPLHSLIDEWING